MPLPAGRRQLGWKELYWASSQLSLSGSIRASRYDQDDKGEWYILCYIRNIASLFKSLNLSTVVFPSEVMWYVSIYVKSNGTIYRPSLLLLQLVCVSCLSQARSLTLSRLGPFPERRGTPTSLKWDSLSLKPPKPFIAFSCGVGWGSGQGGGQARPLVLPLAPLTSPWPGRGVTA